MGTMKFAKLQYAFTVIIFTVVTGNGIEIQNGNTDLRLYLEKAVENYTTWLKENGLDPSPPTSSIMKDSRHGVQFDCNLSNHIVSGHSDTVTASVDALSSFIGNRFEMGREAGNATLCEFYADFDCTGSLSASYYPDLSKNLPFSVQGNFAVTSNHSYDYVVMKNVGVTQDYALDMTHSWGEHLMFAIQKTFQLNGRWNDSLISGKYMDNVTEAFAYIYSDYPLWRQNNASFPSTLLFEQFAREIAAKINLTEIIEKEEDLPSPYVPTPSTTTTTTTTSTTTSTTTTTTPPTSERTTPTTTPSTGQGEVVIPGCSTVLQMLFILFCNFPLI